MITLELVNTLALTFFVSEYLYEVEVKAIALGLDAGDTNSNGENGKRNLLFFAKRFLNYRYRKLLLLVLVSVNIVLSSYVAQLVGVLWQPASDLLQLLHNEIDTLSSKSHANISDWVGSNLLVSFVVSSLLGLAALVRFRLILSRLNILSKIVGFIALVLFVLVLLEVTKVAEDLHITVATQLFGAALSFFTVCYFDTKRFENDLSLFKYLNHVGEALVYFVPAFPITAVLISTGFFVVVVTIENLGFDPTFLNWPVYYWYVPFCFGVSVLMFSSTMYGPFTILYLEIKKRCLYGVSTKQYRSRV